MCSWMCRACVFACLCDCVCSLSHCLPPAVLICLSVTGTLISPVHVLQKSWINDDNRSACKSLEMFTAWLWIRVTLIYHCWCLQLILNAEKVFHLMRKNWFVICPFPTHFITLLCTIFHYKFSWHNIYIATIYINNIKFFAKHSLLTELQKSNRSETYIQCTEIL